MIIDEIMVVQKQDMQKHVRTPEITCTHPLKIVIKVPISEYLQLSPWLSPTMTHEPDHGLCLNLCDHTKFSTKFSARVIVEIVATAFIYYTKFSRVPVPSTSRSTLRLITKLWTEIWTLKISLLNYHRYYSLGISVVTIRYFKLRYSLVDQFSARAKD